MAVLEIAATKKILLLMVVLRRQTGDEGGWWKVWPSWNGIRRHRWGVLMWGKVKLASDLKISRNSPSAIMQMISSTAPLPPLVHPLGPAHLLLPLMQENPLLADFPPEPHSTGWEMMRVRQYRVVEGE